LPSLFLNAERRLRNGWWILIFFGVLAAILLPLIVSAKSSGSAVSPIQQAAVVLVASCICQLLRRRPLSELFGRLDITWLRELAWGALAGASMMLVPALLLASLGLVSWQWSPSGSLLLSSAVRHLAGAAAAEELMFRGFIFQRLIDGLGQWPAQFIVAGYFVLTHSDGLSGAGELGPLAGVNIFLASVMFGLAFIRTRSLAMPFGLHFSANVTQGPILGFGVSGDSQPGLLQSTILGGPAWLTGGAFGLEASVPGLLCVLVAVVVLYRWKPSCEKSPALPTDKAHLQ